jgi:hypothetical protein
MGPVSVRTSYASTFVYDLDRRAHDAPKDFARRVIWSSYKERPGTRPRVASGPPQARYPKLPLRATGSAT